MPILEPPMGRDDSLEKDSDVGKDWGQNEKKVTEDEMVGWHHRFNRHEFEQALGDSEGWGSLARCSAAWDFRVKHVIVTKQQYSFFFLIFIFLIFLYFFPFIFISWRLITLQYCSGFCHTLTWISHGFTCVPHLDPPSHLPLHPIPLGLPSAPGPSTCLMHPTWVGELFHPR